MKKFKRKHRLESEKFSLSRLAMKVFVARAQGPDAFPSGESGVKLDLRLVVTVVSLTRL
jgi:hypothetical protein